MIKAFAHEGDIFENDALAKEFRLNLKKDITFIQKVDADSGKETDLFDQRLSFVGFASNEKDDLFVVFPKHYRVDNLADDARSLFAVLAKHFRKKHKNFYGIKPDCQIDSTFPFDAFFQIYRYYELFGLYFDERSIVQPNSGGKIVWKDTIRRSGKYLYDGNKFAMFPFYFRKKMNVSTFLTTCMIFAINYTIEKFGMLVNLPKLQEQTPNLDYIKQRSSIVSELLRIRKTVFRDTAIALIDSLIAFFQRINTSGYYWLKHYSFSSIWEEALSDYLSGHFDGIKGGALSFSAKPSAPITFRKETFRPNLANPNNFFQPDCYGTAADSQFIFDAKYYLAPHGIMYKELAYLFLLRDYSSPADAGKKYKYTYCAVFLPSESRKTGLNFKIDPAFNSSLGEVTIYEEYLDIKEVLSEY